MAWNSIPMGCASRRLLLPLATLALATASLGAGPPANPAAAIAAAAGHPSRRHLRAQATFAGDGQTQTATLEVQGSQRLDRVCAADLCDGSWFDGRRRYTFGINGTPLPERDDDDAAERTFAAIASTAFAEPDFLRAGGSVEALPAAGAVARFRVTAPRGSELVAVADERTGRLTGTELPDGSPYRTLAPSVLGSTTLYGTRVYDRLVTVDEPLTGPSGPPVTFAAATPEPRLSGHLPIVPCQVRGRRARCLIDTGTTPSAMTLEFAEELGQEPRGRIEIGGLATYVTGVVDAGRLTLGGATFERLLLAVVPRVRDADFDLIVGSDALTGVRVEFERETGRIRIGPGELQPRGRPLGLTFAGGRPYVQVRLGDPGPNQAMLLDTGDSGTLSIGYDAYRENTDLFAVRGATAAQGLAGLPMDALAGELGHAEVGGEPLDAVPIVAVRGQHEGHVGFGLAARCARFVLDLGQGRAECVNGSPAAGPRAGDTEK